MKRIAYLALMTWATAMVTVASFAAKPVAQLGVLILFLIIGGLRATLPKKTWSRAPMTGLVFLMLLGASLVSFLQLALWAFPPVTPDGRSVMPIAQAVGGIVLGSVFCVLASWLYFARLQPNPRTEYIWLFVTFIILVIAFTVDYLF